MTVGDRAIASVQGRLVANGNAFEPASKAEIDGFRARIGAALQGAGYPTTADRAGIDSPMVVLILLVFMGFVAITYGPLAALLVEMFPARIRYSSMSLPYHIGAGWFGGLLPTISFALVAEHGNIYAGLAYPVAGALMTFVIGAIWLRDTRETRAAA